MEERDTARPLARHEVSCSAHGGIACLLATAWAVHVKTFLLLSALVLGIAPGYSGAQQTGHAACPDCHRTTGDLAAVPLIDTEERLCGHCHPAALVAAHPSGFPAQRPLPADYPLDRGGIFTCSTCHDVHGGRLRGTRRHQALCAACHTEEFFAAMADAGLSLQHSAHLVTGKDAAAGAEADGYTRHCLGCHADKMMLDAAMRPWGVMGGAARTFSHPVGVPYPVGATAGRYHPATGLRQAVVLPEGRVSCISCHQGYGRVHGALVVPNQASALCLECHDL